jgi:hypothetical protein
MEDASPSGSSGLERFCCDSLGDVVGISAGAGLCLAGPLPDASRDVVVGDAAIRTAHCFEGLVRYEIRSAPGSYLLSGTLSGAYMTGLPDESDGERCAEDPEVDPRVTPRVPRAGEPYRNHLLGFELELAEGAGAKQPTHGFFLEFSLVAGFAAQVVDVSARLPAAVVLAPDGYLYVVDQGDDSSLGGLMGQVLRLLPGDIALDTSFVVR